MFELLKAYLQVAGSLSEVTRDRAMEAARAALAASPAAGMLPVASESVELVTNQMSALADELVASSRANRASFSASILSVLRPSP